VSDGRGDLEFARTTEIVARRLPAAPAVVPDIGGGPGRYALWLASLGYQVEHRDLMPLHVEQLRADAAGVTGIRTAVGDVRDLDLPDASVDHRAGAGAARCRAAPHRDRRPLTPAMRARSSLVASSLPGAAV
jgi:SAM-dependent methyltransferase